MNLFGFFVRREACKLAALALQGQCLEPDVGPRLWALSVFFESYMHSGASGTQADFGPKEPEPLKVVRTADR